MRAKPVSVTTRSMWRLRFSGGATRWVLYALAAWGIAASARTAIDPPHPVVQRAVAAPGLDLAAAGMAVDFTRRYLTLSGGAEDHARSLAQFVGEQLDPDAGMQGFGGMRQRVRWAQVVQQRAGQGGARVFTVAAQTDRAGTLYLSVPIVRAHDGTLRLGGYPAFVGAPDAAPASASPQLREVSDDGLRAVCLRALRNYLLGAADNLRADLSDDARVALPGLTLRMGRLIALTWSPSGRSVLASVEASEAAGLSYTLRYELDVRRAPERWEISAIQMDPTTS